MHYLNLPREIFDLKNLIVFCVFSWKLLRQIQNVVPRKLTPGRLPLTLTLIQGEIFWVGNLSGGNSPVTENVPTPTIPHKMFWDQLTKSSIFWKGDWALGYAFAQLWDFPKISSFPKTVILRFLCNSWGNEYINFWW